MLRLVLALATALFPLAFFTMTCEARSSIAAPHRPYHSALHVPLRKTHHGTGQSAFAAIVLDANSGRTLFARNESELRHPASITKVMTLYLLFEQLERGCLQLNSPITISSHAAAQAPSKIGLPPGQTIDVRSAIEAVVTKSANDVAAAIAEEIGGDEQTFAHMMTAKAHVIGMSRTYFSNASGLPSEGQVTTAKDLATLGEVIQERFPTYFGFFSTRDFAYRGHVYRNHNHPLGKLNGMDGIKTGFIRASGYNLLASVRRKGRNLVAVILGGRTAASRDQAMARLIANNIGKASPVRTAVAIAPKAYAKFGPRSQNCETGTSPDARADSNNGSALGRE